MCILAYLLTCLSEYLHSGKILRYHFSESGVPPNSVLFYGTVPPNSVLFGRTVPPNSFPHNSFVFFCSKKSLCPKEICPAKLSVPQKIVPKKCSQNAGTKPRKKVPQQQVGMAIEEKINNKENNNKKKQTTILNFIEIPKIKTPKKQQPGSPGLGKVMKTTSTKKNSRKIEKEKREKTVKQLQGFWIDFAKKQQFRSQGKPEKGCDNIENNQDFSNRRQ